MIELFGAEGTSEYRVAVMVRNALEALWPGVSTTPHEQDDIRIAVSTKLAGYKVQDIDIVLAGRLARQRYFRPTRVIRGSSGNRLNAQPILVESFVIAIEVKDHADNFVRIIDDQVEVRYSRDGSLKWKSATDQNVSQMHAVKDYLADMHVDVFARRCMVFPSLASITAPSAVATGFNGHQLLTAASTSSRLLERRGQGVLSAGRRENMERVLAAPIFRVTIPTRLDRERMERLMSINPAVDEVLATLGVGTVFVRGYGGTGKTVLILQAAWKIFRQEGKRSLILTYNHALAADMRRLTALMNIPASVEEGGIRIGTVMSFLYKWFARLHLIDGDELDYARYPELCASAVEMFCEGAVRRDDIEEIVASDPDAFDFDQIFVDEGQDWPEGETALLKELYSPTRLCVADGVDQLTRGQRANWKSGLPREACKTLPLPTCLRLKRNLSLFVDALAKVTGMGWEAEPNPAAGGGEVIVLCRPYGQAKDLHDEIVAALHADGNSAVDMLFCVPPTRVNEAGGRRDSDMARLLEGWGQPCWDGVDPRSRLDFPRSADKARVVQYASCRGLEGWTVVLDGFDEFLDWAARQKLKIELTEEEHEGFVDLGMAAEREAWQWGMVALTRPIDTLVIQLADKESHFSRQLIDMVSNFPDFARLVE
ncbi:DNA/RNA helicase [Halomonas sp. LBP4]|uniref:DNA/RNA helicase n=1 Tax=Halomonas sp. LBP4 TaxID=2044917 RepID=UPI000D758124|nr:DNA/RNA helicase [Halomonas sp. LBP4]PXX98294.1 DNA/RNA helicase [Halomonas sp. LBP4]